jgi:L-alanine-DL-glutamate epimerase-like enolase superfamily enzyme
MKIAEIKSLHADAGGRAFDYLKITADDGLVGWSEYNESFGGVGVTAAIDSLAPGLIGKDPRPLGMLHMLEMPDLRWSDEAIELSQSS